MTRTLLAALVFASLAAPALAEGLSARIDAYIGALDERRALEAIPGVTGLSDHYANALRRERALGAELDALSAAHDDLADIVVRERARRLLAAQAANQSLVPWDRPTNGLTGAEGAIVRDRPGHGSHQTQSLDPWTRVTVTGQAGEWLRLDSGGYVHGCLIELDGESNPGPGVPAVYTRIKDQKPTYYMTAREAGYPTSGPLYGHSYDGTEKKKIQTPDGTVVAETSGRFFACLVMEGSGIIRDGRGVSWASNNRFDVLPTGCKGITSTGAWVVPFHTLAVNPREMSYGTVYFIPRTLGLVLPDGTVHDGFWFAHDTGSAFQGTPKHRTDMYVDFESSIAWSEAHITPSFTPMPFYRVDAATQRQVLAKYKDQLGPPSPPSFAAR